MEDEVHPGDRGGDGDELLPVEADGAGVAAATFHLGEAGDEHAARAGGRVVDGLARLGLEHLRHEVDERAVRVELLGGMARVVGELLDEVLVAVPELVLGHVGEAERVLGEVLDEVLERGVGGLALVGPVGVAEDAVEAFGLAVSIAWKALSRSAPDILGGGADVLPVRAVGMVKRSLAVAVA